MRLRVGAVAAPAASLIVAVAAAVAVGAAVGGGVGVTLGRQRAVPGRRGAAPRTPARFIGPTATRTHKTHHSSAFCT